MIRFRRTYLTIGAAALLIAGYGILTTLNANASERRVAAQAAAADPPFEQVNFALAPTSKVMAACLPNMELQVTVKQTEELIGADILQVKASGLRPNTPFTLFLNEKPADPFGAVEYFGDLNTDKDGNGHNAFKLIVEEAFASTLVGGKRVRVDLNHMGMWFADPAGDDFCLGKGKGKVTPFDGDAEAGEQVMNSANSLPAAPIP